MIQSQKLNLLLNDKNIKSIVLDTRLSGHFNVSNIKNSINIIDQADIKNIYDIDTYNNIIIITSYTFNNINTLQHKKNIYDIINSLFIYNKNIFISSSSFKQYRDLYKNDIIEKGKINIIINDIKTYKNNSNEDLTEIITDKLYISNECTANNIKLLEKHKIFNILNVAKEANNTTINDKRFSHFKIPLEDNIYQNISINQFIDAFTFIDNCINNNSKILIHCQAGKSRSPTIIISYLILKKTIG